MSLQLAAQFADERENSPSMKSAVELRVRDPGLEIVRLEEEIERNENDADASAGKVERQIVDVVASENADPETLAERVAFAVRPRGAINARGKSACDKARSIRGDDGRPLG